MFNNIKNKLLVCFFSLVLFCCNQEDKTKEDVSECRQLTIIVEDCMEIHRGALNYIDSCGSLDLEEVKSLDTCEEILDYFGINLIKKKDESK